MQTPTRAIHLEVHLDGDSPNGRAYEDGGGSREFSGWMSLVAAIEALLSVPPGGARRPTGLTNTNRR